MANITQQLAEFACQFNYEDLPGSIIQETKQVLMEHIGTALGALSTDKGKMMASLGKRSGGAPESSIIGLGDKISSSNAALVNGELMITLDYSDIIAGGHDGTYVLPAILALAESIGASGKDLILASAIGLEISARLARAVGRHNITPEDVKRQASGARGLTGNAYSNFGAAAGAGRLLDLDSRRMLHALGLAGHLTMVLSYGRWGVGGHSYMAKYGIPGWQSTGAVTAVLLAEMGYTGDTTVLDDSERGFTYFVGYPNWYPDEITTELGKNWIYNQKLHYKPYPCCGAFHSVLDCLYNVIEEHNLVPEEIESIDVFGAGSISKELSSISSAQFNMQYNMSVAAHGITRGVEWVDQDTMNNPDIRKFMDKITGQPHPDAMKEMEKDPRTRLGKAVVTARGKTFTNEVKYRRGDTFTGVAWTEKEIVDKFRHNAARALTKQKTEKCIESISNLERVNDISELMKSITL